MASSDLGESSDCKRKHKICCDPFSCHEQWQKHLHPHGPTKSFYYPQRCDILIMPRQDILTAVNPTTSTGRSYLLSADEMNAATGKLEDSNSNH